MPKKYSKYLIKGREVPSVTTILGNTLHKPGLQEWYGRLGKVEAERQRDEAASFGDKVHTAIEAHFTGQKTGKLDSRVQTALDNMIIWAEANIDEWLDFEQAVYHDELLYAGTIDAFVRLKGGKVCIADFKSSKSMRDEYHLQVAAYRGATRTESKKVKLQDIEGCFILHLDRNDLTWRPHATRPQEECFPIFQKTLEIYTWLQMMQKARHG